MNFEKDLDANLNAFNISNIKKERKFLYIFKLDFEIDNIDLKTIILENDNFDLESLKYHIDGMEVKKTSDDNKKGKRKNFKKKIKRK